MKTASITSVKRSEGQETNLKNQLAAGAIRAFDLLLKKLDPDKDGMDRLISNGDELIDSMVDAVLGKSRQLATPDQYSDEEVESDYEYPDEYKGPRPITEQVKKLAEVFGFDPKPALEFADKVLPTLALPNGAEGWFAIISPSGLEKLVPQAVSVEDRYCKGVTLVFQKIAAYRRFYNYREGQIDTYHLRQHPHTVAAIAKIAEVQKGDILIIPAQVGLRHRGRSTRRAQVCFTNGEFGLRWLDGGCTAITHPERFVRFSELDVDLPGDEFFPDAGGDFSEAPYLRFVVDGLRADASGVGLAFVSYGSGSAFLPQ